MSLKPATALRVRDQAGNVGRVDGLLLDVLQRGVLRVADLDRRSDRFQPRAPVPAQARTTIREKPE
jgi:hypothetical protein